MLVRFQPALPNHRCPCTLIGKAEILKRFCLSVRIRPGVPNLKNTYSIKILLKIKLKSILFNITRLRIVDNAQRYERWDGGPIPPGGTKELKPLYLNRYRGFVVLLFGK